MLAQTNVFEGENLPVLNPPRAVEEPAQEPSKTDIVTLLTNFINQAMRGAVPQVKTEEELDQMAKLRDYLAADEQKERTRHLSEELHKMENAVLDSNMSVEARQKFFEEVRAQIIEIGKRDKGPDGQELSLEQKARILDIMVEGETKRIPQLGADEKLAMLDKLDDKMEAEIKFKEELLKLEKGDRSAYAKFAASDVSRRYQDEMIKLGMSEEGANVIVNHYLESHEGSSAVYKGDFIKKELEMNKREIRIVKMEQEYVQMREELGHDKAAIVKDLESIFKQTADDAYAKHPGGTPEFNDVRGLSLPKKSYEASIAVEDALLERMGSENQKLKNQKQSKGKSAENSPFDDATHERIANETKHMPPMDKDFHQPNGVPPEGRQSPGAAEAGRNKGRETP